MCSVLYSIGAGPGLGFAGPAQPHDCYTVTAMWLTTTAVRMSVAGTGRKN